MHVCFHSSSTDCIDGGSVLCLSWFQFSVHVHVHVMGVGCFHSYLIHELLGSCLLRLLQCLPLGLS